MTLRQALATVAVAGLLLAGCNGGEQEEPPPIPDPPFQENHARSPSPTPSPAEAAPDPRVVPDDPADIDEAYVQAVLDALHEPLGEAYRIALHGAPFEDGALPVELSRVISEIYTEEWQEGIREARASELSEPRWSQEVEPALKPPDEWDPVIYTVIEVNVVTPDCVLVLTQPDPSPSLREPPGEVGPIGFVLRERPPGDAPTRLNPTAWRMDANTNIDAARDVWGEHRCEP